MKRFWVYPLIVLSAVIIFSCKKNKPDTKSNCDLTEANLIGTFGYDSVRYKASPSSPAVDAASLVDSCSLDDVVTLTSNHMLTYTDAGIKCNPAGDGTGTWSLSGTTLTLEGQAAHIDNFTCGKFTAAQPDFFQAGDTLLITFKKQ